MSNKEIEKLDIGQLTKKLIDLTAIVTGLEKVINKPTTTQQSSQSQSDLAAENAILRELIKRLL